LGDWGSLPNFAFYAAVLGIVRDWSAERARKPAGFVVLTVILRGVVGLLYLVFIVFAVILGVHLAWAVTPLAAVATGIAALLAAITRRRHWDEFRVPPALPLGMWIIACLVGWDHTDTTVSCVDWA